MPWDDPTLEPWGLNDGYMSRDMHGLGHRRFGRWFELHPLDKFYYRAPDKKVVYAEDVPPGHYVRPTGHVEWLQKFSVTNPVYLQGEPPEGFGPNAMRFPIEDAEARFGAYWASGPSYMVALAIMEGVQEIHVYGIHLSTQAEYIEQRGNFEHLLGLARGLGITVVMAKESPLLKHPWKYAYEPKPHGTVNPLHKELHEVRKAKSSLVASLVNWPRFKSKATEMEQLRRLEAKEIAIQQRLALSQGCGTLTTPVIAA